MDFFEVLMKSLDRPLRHRKYKNLHTTLGGAQALQSFPWIIDEEKLNEYTSEQRTKMKTDLTDIFLPCFHDF